MNSRDLERWTEDFERYCARALFSTERGKGTYSHMYANKSTRDAYAGYIAGRMKLGKVKRSTRT